MPWTGPELATKGLAIRRPSLDDVFLALTGHAADSEDDQLSPARGARGRGLPAVVTSTEEYDR